MRDTLPRDLPRSWGPQMAAIPTGTWAALLAWAALLFGVAAEVPEVRAWALIALPASAVIGIVYVVVRRRMSKPPIDLHIS